MGYVHQANIAQGNQQVNNAPDGPGTTPGVGKSEAEK